MSDATFHDYIVYDILEGVSSITSRRMFGGWGIYKDGVFFALIAGDELYFKASDMTLQKYKNADSRPFTYSKKDKMVSLSYWLVGEEILENKETLMEWVEEAVEAQKRVKN
jgi:DNA transformation protein